MDSNDIKQIIISYYAIKDACKAMLKPIKTNLNDAETVHKMPEVQQGSLEYIQTKCEGIQEALWALEHDIDNLKESVYNDGEVEEAREMISDILFDIQPHGNKLDPYSMESVAETIRKNQVKVGEQVVVENLKKLGL